MLKYKRSDVSIAVATDTGLITPIVKSAEGKSLKDVSNEVKALAKKARDGKLKPEEYQGGTMTVSNLGMYGVDVFTAILNPPQCTILAVGAAVEKPVVKDGQIVIATTMVCTASFDHRAIDGAVGAQFLAEFKKLIEETPHLLLM
jgi:pyruvate dehydrogenase E2 component (dihydrolipoamide acetyltransferase)